MDFCERELDTLGAAILDRHPPHFCSARHMLLGTDPSTPRIQPAQASLDLELPVGKQLIEATDRLWLTVVAAKPEEKG